MASSICMGRGAQNSYPFKIVIVAWITSLIVAALVRISNVVSTFVIRAVCLGLLCDFATQVSVRADCPKCLYPCLCIEAS